MRLSNKVCLITAAAQGIGRATAIKFASEGAKVIATDINLELLSSLSSAHHNIETAYLDVSDSKQIKSFAEQYMNVNVLFNCAGWVPAGDILACDEQQWHRAFELNVSSMYYMIRAFLPQMLSQSGGSIINMSSAASSIKGVSNRFAYSSSKAAVIGLTKSIAADYILQGIRCNAICPGTIDSPSLQQRIKQQALEQGRSEADVHADFVARQPMGRVGQADEVAALALYLASDESAFTTGSVHMIDGGWTT